MQVSGLFNFFFTKEFFLEDKQHKNPGSDGRIGDIKDRPEEFELLPAPDGEPGRKRCINNGKIEHIDDPPVQKRSIAAFGREKCCNSVIGTVD